MGGKNTVIANEQPKIAGFQIQSSVYGLPLPIGWGTSRLTANLIYYSDFTAIPLTTTTNSGGKGGGGVTQKDTSYTYTASIIMGIQQGPITAIPNVWIDKKKQAFAATPFSLFTGAVGQAVWPFLTTNHPTEAIGYSGMAYVAKSNYLLDDNAALPMHSFEVQSTFRYGAFADAEPSTIVNDILTNPLYGVGWQAANIGSLTNYSNYCIAAGLFISPALVEQVEAQQFLEDLAMATNSAWVPSEGQIKIVPYADTPVTGNSVTYTPNMTPLYDLTDDDFLAASDADPVICTRKTQADSFNHIQIEYRDRAHDYNIAIAEAKDAANIERYGLRTKPIIKGHAICVTATAGFVAQTILQRDLYTRNQHQFKLGVRFALLEPMDLVTVTDLGLGMTQALCRVVTIEENDDGDFDFIVEEVPTGIHTPALFQLQDPLGYTPDYNAAAGNVDSPVFFEPPVELASDLLEVWIGVTGTVANWGGCNVWASLDGTTYKLVGTVKGGARYGALAVALPAAAAGTDTVNTLAVSLDGTGGQLLSGSALDMQNLSTLMYVDGEYLAYQTATFVATNRYNLTTLNRGAYDSPSGLHVLGAPWARIDDAILRFPLELNYIGKQIYFKFTSFNIYGGGEQSQAAVSPFLYTVTGAFANLPPPVVDTFLFSEQADGTRQFTWAWTTTPIPKDLLGYKLRYISGGSGTWATMTDMHVGFVAQSPFESNQFPGGVFTFAIKTVDKLGNLSASEKYITATLGDPRLGGVLYGVFPNEIGWPGTVTSCFRDGTILSADGDPWSTRTAWSTWTTWNQVPVTPIQYDHSTIDLGASVPFVPLITATGTGTLTTTISTSIDNITYSTYAAPPTTPITKRYIKVRVSCAGTNAAINTLAILLDGNEKKDSIQDLLTSTLTGANRIAVGDIRLPLTKTYITITQVRVTLQNTGAGWSWELIDKAVANGPRIKIYNAANALADATIDAEIIGV